MYRNQGVHVRILHHPVKRFKYNYNSKDRNKWKPTRRLEKKYQDIYLRHSGLATLGGQKVIVLTLGTHTRHQSSAVRQLEMSQRYTITVTEQILTPVLTKHTVIGQSALFLCPLALND